MATIDKAMPKIIHNASDGSRWYIDITGQRFGSLFVIERTDEQKHKQWLWRCKCDCGLECFYRSNSLRNGEITRCKECAKKAMMDDITGNKYAQLLVTGFSHRKYRKKGVDYYWDCLCDCGNIRKVMSNHLKSGHTRSCGCLDLESKIKRMTIHGMCKTRLFNIWQKMIIRCNNEKDLRYNDYGGRGIIVCDEWRSKFLSFYNWAIFNGYNDALEIDRINNDGNYEPSNCRWVGDIIQARNKRNNVWAEMWGDNYLLLEIGELTGLKMGNLYARYSNGKRGYDLIRPVEAK